jgi:hypothetical protein
VTEYTIESGTSLDEAVGVAIGAASVCWESPEGAGVFLSERAAAISEELVAAIRDGRVMVDGRKAPDGAPWYAHLDAPCGPECARQHADG